MHCFRWYSRSNLISVFVRATEYDPLKKMKITGKRQKRCYKIGSTIRHCGLYVWLGLTQFDWSQIFTYSFLFISINFNALEIKQNIFRNGIDFRNLLITYHSDIQRKPEKTKCCKTIHSFTFIQPIYFIDFSSFFKLAETSEN